MLSIPNEGFTRSVEKIRMDISVVSDWIECSILLEGEETSINEVVDYLCDSSHCANQEIGHEIVNAAWSDIQRRISWIGAESGLEIDDSWIRRQRDWRDAVAHTFCVILSLAPKYSWWSSTFGRDYTEQGELFELLTQHSLQTQLGDTWTIMRTGWGGGIPISFEDVVQRIANAIFEEPYPEPMWINEQQKELGLDLLCYRTFVDSRPSMPVYMLQCASGGNWKEKLHTPKLDKWKKVINFHNFPIKAFAIPFCVEDRDFYSSSIDIGGVFVERCRLLSANQYDRAWLPDDVNQRMRDWLDPRVSELLRRSR